MSRDVTSAARNVVASLGCHMGREAHVSDKGYPVFAVINVPISRQYAIGGLLDDMQAN